MLSGWRGLRGDQSICAEAGYEDVEVQVGSGYRWLKG